jgi:hypothetical protein
MAFWKPPGVDVSSARKLGGETLWGGGVQGGHIQNSYMAIGGRTPAWAETSLRGSVQGRLQGGSVQVQAQCKIGQLPGPLCQVPEVSHATSAAWNHIA